MSLKPILSFPEGRDNKTIKAKIDLDDYVLMLRGELNDEL